MAATLRYLTVPDMLWLNLQLTGAPQGYRFDRLEEATFYQYSRGKSLDVVGQAARMLVGFRKMRPFEKGNDATAFVATVAFLKMNGFELTLPDDEAGAWLASVWAEPANAKTALEGRLATTMPEADPVEVHDSHEAARDAIDSYPMTIARLLADEKPLPVGR